MYSIVFCTSPIRRARAGLTFWPSIVLFCANICRSKKKTHPMAKRLVVTQSYRVLQKKNSHSTWQASNVQQMSLFRPRPHAVSHPSPGKVHLRYPILAWARNICSNLFLVTKRPAFPTTLLGPHYFPCPVRHLQFATSNVQSIILLSFFSQSILFPLNGDIFFKRSPRYGRGRCSSVGGVKGASASKFRSLWLKHSRAKKLAASIAAWLSSPSRYKGRC